MLLLRTVLWCVIWRSSGLLAQAAAVGELSEASTPVAFDFTSLSEASNPFFSKTSAASAIAVSRDGRNVYVGGDKGGLAWLTRDVATGDLRYQQGWPASAFTTALKAVQHVSISEDDGYMVICGNKADPYGSLGIFSLDVDGTPSLLYQEEIPDIQHALFAPGSATDFYTIDQTNMELRLWSYSSADHGFSVQQAIALEGPSPDALAISPDGLNVYVHDSSSAKNFNFARDPATGLVGESPASTLQGDPNAVGSDGIGHWSSMAFSSSAPFAFALETLVGQVTVLSRAVGNGALAVLSKFPVAYDDGAAVACRADAPLLLASDDDVDLYVLGESRGQIGWLQFDAATHALHANGWFVTGSRPRQLIADAAYEHVYATFAATNTTFAATNTNFKWKGAHFNREPAVPPTPAPTTPQPTSATTYSVESQTLLLGESADTFNLMLIAVHKSVELAQAEEEKFILALQASPNDALAHNNYGHFLQHKRSNYAGAERHYRLALQCDPTADYAQNSLGHLLQHVRKDIDGAENAYREAVRLQPTNSDAHCNLGYLLQHERHDAAGAEQCYKNAIAFNPDSLLAHYNMAFLQEKELGNLELAEQEYTEALRCDPKDEDAKCRLVKVQVARANAGPVGPLKQS
ncbi:hypothetical protein JKP88DRAFT_173170 [Tribonema minus]|uniref:Tetratricopeptide repeat protein n=1 Tax=Tribonema minus TaxID=303371 RepID=A0A835ZFA9_9STRA|nr:hypothetical protein JKP88DRAFT_173170 [Tribonema minus]